jgi:hypothetical protein
MADVKYVMNKDGLWRLKTTAGVKPSSEWVQVSPAPEDPQP